MKKFFYTMILALIVTATVSSCTEDNVKPRDGGSTSSDICQFGGPGCR